MEDEVVWHKGTPKPEKLIECIGYDWCEFKCAGKFMLYKGKPVKGKIARFAIMKIDGSFEPDAKTWRDIEKWRYIN